MCTAISIDGKRHFFGRTLDVECSYGEQIALIPRNYSLEFRHEGVSFSHLAMLGTAHVRDGVPLFYDAVNEAGLCAAALRFSDACEYSHAHAAGRRLASYEVISYVLAACKTTDDAGRLLEDVVITDDRFSAELAAEPLHWIFADGSGTVILESTAGGVSIYKGPYRILTNAPELPRHIKNAETSASPPLFSGLSSEARFLRAVYSAERIPIRSVSDVLHLMSTVAVPRGFVKGRGGKDRYTLYTAVINSNLGEYTFTTYNDPIPRTVSIFKENLDSPTLITYDMTNDGETVYLN